jgi:hypothetical protein
LDNNLRTKRVRYVSIEQTIFFTLLNADIEIIAEKEDKRKKEKKGVRWNVSERERKGERENKRERREKERESIARSRERESYLIREEIVPTARAEPAKLTTWIHSKSLLATIAYLKVRRFENKKKRKKRNWCALEK